MCLEPRKRLAPSLGGSNTAPLIPGLNPGPCCWEMGRNCCAEFARPWGSYAQTATGNLVRSSFPNHASKPRSKVPRRVLEDGEQPRGYPAHGVPSSGGTQFRTLEDFNSGGSSRSFR